jgi:hypothetical protein
MYLSPETLIQIKIVLEGNTHYMFLFWLRLTTLHQDWGTPSEILRKVRFITFHTY